MSIRQPLTELERHTLQLVKYGNTYRDIAGMEGVSVAAINTRITRIRFKLRVPRDVNTKDIKLEG